MFTYRTEYLAMGQTKFIPVTPGGTTLDWLEADTEEEAWEKLLKDAAHMPYKTKEGFVERGYTVESWDEDA